MDCVRFGDISDLLCLSFLKITTTLFKNGNPYFVNNRSHSILILPVGFHHQLNICLFSILIPDKCGGD